MKHLWKALMMVRRCDPRSFWLRIVYVLLQSVLPLVNLYILKLLVDGVTAAASHQLPPTTYQLPDISYLLPAFIAVFLLGRIISTLNGINNDILGQRLIDYTTAVMQNHAASLDLGYYDTPAFHDTLHRAQQEASSRPMQIMNSFMALGGATVMLGGIVGMLGASSPWVIPVMVVAVVPAFIVRLHKARSIYRFRRSSTQLYRQTGYYGSVLTSRPFAAELRAFRLAPRFRRLFTDRRRTLATRLLAISRRLGALDILCAIVEAAALLAVVWMLIHQALTAAISVGTFVMLFEAFRRGQGQLTTFATSIASLYDNRLFASNLFEFLDLRPTILAPDDPLPVPQTIETVELRDVTFRYPGAERDALQHFNLTCRRGQITHIQGQNGYGKTTVLRLILRLYDPQQGAVLVNGTDIRRFSPEELRSRIGVLFQDFARYAATVRENIEYGSDVRCEMNDVRCKMDDECEQVAGSGEQAAATSYQLPATSLHHTSTSSPLLDFVSRLPQGYDTPLGRIFDGGQELSMGQWQRLALARALASDSPILLLDEPMAWMDQPTREIFLRELEKMKTDRIIVLINHI